MSRLIVFFDPSAVVKWFVDEERAAEVEQLRRESTGAISQRPRRWDIRTTEGS